MTNEVPNALTMGELHEKVLKKDADLSTQVYVDGDHIVINVKYEYEIALSRCDTNEKILAWTHHLLEKTWMTNEVLRRFISLATATHNLKLPTT